MQTMINFSTWFLSNLPTFFMAEPIRYIWSLVLLAYLFRLVLDLRRY